MMLHNLRVLVIWTKVALALDGLEGLLVWAATDYAVTYVQRRDALSSKNIIEMCHNIVLVYLCSIL